MTHFFASPILDGMDHAQFKSWRMKRYRTQREASEVLGVTRETVCVWETGKSKPPGNLLELACKAIDRERQEREQAE